MPIHETNHAVEDAETLAPGIGRLGVFMRSSCDSDG